ncbi:hypothetical protein PRIPAC_85471 [Pristionchus pacificus]|uniref:Uncharacterized protein n=1 Tax=Pristionchus pacificus TaxID=54126 RepID=A0A2A6CET1_PRIPA|nr:hypothetical protein PRIPAC_85471 [Pristionchus pacificus]|eukprot:PDM76610.1 hypothetical protein PRIPAC_42976 [Pristionchus pacificus]
MALAVAILEITLFLCIEILSRPRKFGILKAVFFGHNALKYAVVLGFLPFALKRFTALRHPSGVFPSHCFSLGSAGSWASP